MNGEDGDFLTNDKKMRRARAFKTNNYFMQINVNYSLYSDTVLAK